MATANHEGLVWLASLRVCVSLCRMQGCVCICFVPAGIRNGYLHVDRHRVIGGREQKQEDHSFFLLKKGNELRSLSAELWTKPKRETSVVSNQTESLHLHTQCFYCKIYQLATRGRPRGLYWLISFISCKTKCTLQKTTKTSLSKIKLYCLTWHHTWFCTDEFVNLFYQDSNRVRCSYILVAAF